MLGKLTEDEAREMLAQENERLGARVVAQGIRENDFSQKAEIAAMQRAYARGWRDQCDVVSACLV